ncbi:translation initiation factor eIF-2B subunit epsilon [Copidosoma floridanum]|uniref:translation initiation factor eIF-2B subunit epsilon n=1 Tax=Copidosoma floridanum TaxID=29053 RepID=UPI0006C9D571|nr:translation initiation factor eIF-2B subunit epsilon [Copidosoma floridanum]
MSGNTKKESQKGGFGKQESLQAVVFTDDFVHDLRPADRVFPSTLLPIISCPLLDYLLETLARSRVQQVFLYLSNHVEKLKTHLDSLKNVLDKSMVITTIVSDGCRSLGDALRDIDTKGFIRGDFILIRGTAFTNVDFRTYMDHHKARKEKDKNVAMTMIFRNLGNIKDSVLKNESSYVVSSANSKKLLFYKKCTPNEKKVEMELQWFLEHDKVNIDTALFDTHMYICSQSVLPLFADNFDFQTMEDFIRGVLMNEEFIDSRIYWEPLINPEYALPINSWKAYQMICRDILQRQCYPLVPDTLPLSMRDFTYMSRSTYKHHTSTVSKGCTLHSEAIIGEHSTLGENSFVKRSVIGSKCSIGSNVNIYNSYIMSGVKIQDNCIVTDSIIFSNCTIENGKKIEACILLPYVKCSSNYSDVFLELSSDDTVVHTKLEQLFEDDENYSSILRNDDSKVDFDDASSMSSDSSAWSAPSSRESIPLAVLQDDNDLFLSEVIDSLLRGFEDQLKCENLILEINSSRYAYNINIRQVSHNVIKAILRLPLHHYSKIEADSKNQMKSAEYFKILKKILEYFNPIIENYIKTENAQEDCLNAIQDVVFTNETLVKPYVIHLIKYLYDRDILVEEKIIEWYEQDFFSTEDAQLFNTESDNLTQEEKRCISASMRKEMAPFINWLKEAEESSDSQ